MISVESLSKQYGSIYAVRDLSFDVKSGEILGFLGPNGAGKTTTMRILTGFLSPTRGSAQVCAFDVVDDSLEVRRRLGYLPEHTPVYTDMTVYEFLMFIAEARQIPRSRRRVAVMEAATDCGLEKVVGRLIGHLSKGYRQRTCLAQALVHRPQVLILDEPTTGLDPNQIVEIRNLVRDLGRERAIVWSTHILSEVEALCARVLIINEGQAVAMGTPQELRDRLPDARPLRLSLRSDGNGTQQKLSGLAGVKTITALPSEISGEVRFEIEAEPGSDLRDDLFQLAVSSGWKLTGLARVEPTLEDVFRHLTGRN